MAGDEDDVPEAVVADEDVASALVVVLVVAFGYEEDVAAEVAGAGTEKSSPVMRSFVSSSSNPRDFTRSARSSAVTLTPCLDT